MSINISMIKRIYKGSHYIDSISHGLDTIKYNEKKNNGNYLKILTHSGLYDLDYNLNFIDCNFNYGLEYSISEVCYSSDNHIYILTRDYVVRKFTMDLKEVAIYRSDKDISNMIIDDNNNIYAYGNNVIIRLNSNLVFENSNTYLDRHKKLIYIGNNRLFLARSSSGCHILNSNTLNSKYDYYFSEIIRDAHADETGNFYVYGDTKLGKLDGTLKLISSISIPIKTLYLKNNNTLYVIEDGNSLSVKKLNGSLEVVASYSHANFLGEIKVKDNLLMIYGGRGAIKLNDNLEFITELNLSGNYIDEIIVDYNLNVYIQHSNYLYKYNENLEKIKEIPFNKYIDLIEFYNDKLYISIDDMLTIYNDNLESIKIMDSIKEGIIDIFFFDGYAYTLSKYYNLFRINNNLDEVMSFEKIGVRFEDLLFDNRAYTINSDNKIRRYNNKLEEINSIYLNSESVRSPILTDNIYIKTDKNKISKVDKGLSTISIYSHNRNIYEIYSIKNSKNILIEDDDDVFTVIDSNFEKIGSYLYPGNNYPVYHIDECIYCIDGESIIKLDNTLNILATYNVENTDFLLDQYVFVILDDGSLITVYNDTNVIKLNSNLEEIKRYISTGIVYDIYKLDDNNIIIFNGDGYGKKLNNNLEEVASVVCETPRNLLISNEFYYIITYSEIIKLNKNLEEINRVTTSSNNDSYMFNDGIYINSKYSLIKYDENLEKVNSIDGIYFKDLFNVH